MKVLARLALKKKQPILTANDVKNFIIQKCPLLKKLVFLPEESSDFQNIGFIGPACLLEVGSLQDLETLFEATSVKNTITSKQDDCVVITIGSIYDLELSKEKEKELKMKHPDVKYIVCFSDAELVMV
jgi:hypothetical protein